MPNQVIDKDIKIDNLTLSNINLADKDISQYIIIKFDMNKLIADMIKDSNLDPFTNLTVKDVAQDLKMGENLTNELFRRDDFPSVNIGKTKTIMLLPYLLWKTERRL